MSAVDLVTTEHGSGTTVLILHGLFGRRRNWMSIQKKLSDVGAIITADMRNHGDSPWDDEMSYPAMADDLAALIKKQVTSSAIVIGHSMGGKAAMALALSQPKLVKALCVLDIAPVAYGHEYGTHIAAMRDLPVRDIGRRGDADKHLAEKIDDPGIRAFLLQNLTQDTDGFRWQVNLDAIEHGMTDILNFPAYSSTYSGPTTFIAGEKSSYIDDDSRPAIQALFPAAKFLTVEGAGHWVHAEKPDDVCALLRDFITDNA